jgi:hypothetical protein
MFKHIPSMIDLNPHSPALAGSAGLFKQINGQTGLCVETAID